MPKINFVALNLSYDFKSELHQICLKINDLIPGYEFIPMEQENLHMTLAFLGGCLLQDRKRKMGIVNKNMEEFNLTFENKILEFDEFSLFPDTKKNLVVAKFKCRDKNFIKEMKKFKKLFCEIGAKEENYFTPHITLGKIQGVKANNNINL